jgi:beta-lactamase superfamily II metal-dependent hydrolase
MGKLEIKMFPASYGDSFLVSCHGKKKTNILIDMGFKSTYDNVIKKELVNLNQLGEKISLLVFTHIDEDHILGGIKFLEENGHADSPNIIEVEEVWHNSYRHLQFDKKNNLEEGELDESSLEVLSKIIGQGHGREHGVRSLTDISFLQGSTLASLLLKNGYSHRWNKSFNHKAVKVSIDSEELKTVTINEEVKLTLISPDSEKLDALDKAWRNKLIELGFKDKIYSNNIVDDAFEIYMANMNNRKNVARRLSQISGKELDFEAIANQKFEPDKKEINGSSISFILEFENKKILFLGDSHSDTVEKYLLALLSKTKKEKLYFDAVKISHHGSKHNTSKELLNLIEADKYLISTNGKGKNFKHPDLETLLRIITSKTEKKKLILFNYKPIHLYDQINNQEMKQKYNYELEFTNDLSMSITNEITYIRI